MNEKTAQEFVGLAKVVAQKEAAWADWHNILFGADGKFHELFLTEIERREFFESTYSGQIEEIEAALKEGNSIAEYTRPVTTASGKFVVRIPKSLHRALSMEAKEEGVSMNQLILSKLAISLKVFADRHCERKELEHAN